MTRTLLVAPILALVACAEPPPSDYAEAFPDERLLIAFDDAHSAARLAGDPSEYAAAAREVAGDVNPFVRAVTDTVREITAYEPTWKDGAAGTALWGPWSEDGVDGQLWVQRDAATGSYTWALDVRPTGTEPWSALAAGDFAPDGTGRGNGTGGFFFDFDVAHAVDADEVTGGQAYVTYTVDADGTDADVVFDSLDGEDVTDLDAGYHYTQSPDGTGAMDLAFYADATGDAAIPELVILRVRWHATGEGRGDAYVTAGDLGELVYTATECWDAGSMLTFVEDNAVMEMSGDPAACVFAEAEWNEGTPAL